MNPSRRIVHASSPVIVLSGIPEDLCPCCWGAGTVIVPVKPNPYFYDKRLKWETVKCSACLGTGRAK